MKIVKTVATVAAIAGLAVVTGGAALGLGVSFATTAFGVSAATLLTASSALSIGASLLYKPKSPATSTASSDRLNANIDPRTARKFVFGSTAFPTDIRDQEYTGTEKDLLHRFFVTASHQVSGYREIWLDDKLAWTASGGVTADFAGYLLVDVRTVGNAANALNISSRMGATRRFTGCAWVHMRFKTMGINKKAQSPFAQSIPSRVTIIGDGALTYDPRLDSTVPGGSGPMRAYDQSTWAWNADASRNPALQLLWYLLGWRIQNPATGEMRLAVGKGIPPSRIDMQSFITAANLCDEPVTLAAGGTQPRYRSDGVFSESDATSTVLDQLKAAMNAELDDVDGKLRLTVLHNDLATPIADFSEDDILGEFAWDQTAPLNEMFNVVRGTFIDPSSTSLYQAVDYPEVRISSPDGIDRVEPVNFQTVQDARQAQRLVNQRIARMLYTGRFTATFGHRAWKVQKNDIVRLTFAPLGWTNKLFRVAEAEVQVNGQVPMALQVEHPDIYLWDRDERPAIQPVEPTRYDPYLNPVYQGIEEAGGTAIWDNITGEGKPEDNATVGATIGVDLRLPETPSIPAPPGLIRNDYLKLRADGMLIYQPYGDPAVEAELGRITLPAIGAASEVARRQIETAIDRLGAAVAQALSEASRTRETFRDAGFFVDPATGFVKIYAVEQTAERVSETYFRLDAAESAITQRATRTYVDNAIAVAVLDPSQVPIFEGLEIRITQAETRLDGAEAAITQKASITSVNALGARLGTAEINIEALQGLIELKVDNTQFDALGVRVTSAEETLEALGDTAGITQAVVAARQFPDAVGDAQENALRALLAGDQARRTGFDAISSARNELTVKINSDIAAEARSRQELIVRIGAAEASALNETQARIEGDRVVTSMVTNLTASLNDQLAGFDQRIVALVEQDGLIITTLTQTVSAVRGLGEDAGAAAESALRALLTGDEAARKDAGALAAARSELTAKVNGEVDAVTQRINAMLVRIGGAEASIVAEQLARAAANLAIAQQIEQLIAAVGQANARIDTEENVRADAVSAQASRINEIVARIGEEGAPDAIEALITAASITYVAPLQAQAGRIDEVVARLGAPGAADSLEARIDAAALTYVDPLRAQAERTDDVVARIGAAGSPDAIEAKVEEQRVALVDLEGKVVAYFRVAATDPDGTTYLEIVRDGGAGRIVLGGDTYILGSLIVKETINPEALALDRFVRRVSPAGTGTPSAGQNLLLAQADLGEVTANGSYALSVVGTFQTNVGRTTGTFNGKTLYTNNVPDGGLLVQIVRPDGLVLASFEVNGSQYASELPSNRTVNAGGNLIYDDLTGDDVPGHRILRIYAKRANADSGNVDNGDYYQRDISASYSNFSIATKLKWTFI